VEMVRTFVAVELPAEIRDLLAGVQGELREAMGVAERAVRWSRVEGVHLTLQFLGDVPVEAVTGILEAVRLGCADARAMDLEVGKVGAFPTVDRPRVLWLGLEGDIAQLQALQASIARRLGALGYQPDKPFKPHVTLGRVREHVSRDEVAAISQALRQVRSQPVARGSFTAHDVSLMRSDLKPTGAVYTALGVVELGG
jgi:RNA 2',3'-cyclic 3'-phosphodiesterase